MAPDVVLIADGGGLVAAAPAPIHGAERVAKLLARADRVAAAFETTIVWLNGAPAGRIEIDGELAAVSLVVENGRVTRIYAMRKPAEADAAGRAGRPRPMTGQRFSATPPQIWTEVSSLGPGGGDASARRSRSRARRARSRRTAP